MFRDSNLLGSGVDNTLIENTSKKIIYQAMKKMKNELDKIYSNVAN